MANEEAVALLIDRWDKHLRDEAVASVGEAPIAIDWPDRGAGQGLSSPAQARMIGALTLLAMLASIDKNFLTLVVARIRHDLNIGDVQIGLLIGIAFAISNVAVSIPAGWLADRRDRRRIVAAAVGLWSLMAALCGTATSFAAMFAARIGVGLGEGLSPPASYSLLRDGIPQDRHGRAYGVFSIASSLGAGLSFVVAGALLGLVVALRIDRLPLIGVVHVWQVALILIGLLGFPLTLLAFAFPDPGRAAAAGSQAVGYGETLRLISDRRAVLLPLLVYSVALATLTSGWAAWAPALIERGLGLAPQQIGFALGLTLMIGAPVGLIGAGVLMDRLPHHGVTIAAVASAIVMAIATGVAPMTHSLGMFLVPQTLITLASMMFLPVVSTVVARTMPAAAIGKTMAIFLLVQGAVGAGLGPLVLALISDSLFAGDPLALNEAATTTAFVLGAIATVGAIALRPPRLEP